MSTGCFHVINRVPKWVQSCLGSKQETPGLRRPSSLEVDSVEDDRCMDSEMAMRIEHWLRAQPDPQHDLVADGGVNWLRSHSHSHQLSQGDIGIRPPVNHLSSCPSSISDIHYSNPLLAGQELPICSEQRVKYGTDYTHSGRCSNVCDYGETYQKTKELNSRRGADMLRVHRFKQHLKQQEHECLMMINGLEALKRELVKEMTSLHDALEYAYQQRMENDTFLQANGERGGSSESETSFRSPRRSAFEDVPEDLQVMVNDCLESRHGVHTKACVVCMEDFTAEDLMEVSRSDRCRHAIHPCGHAVLCGSCAKSLWDTTRKCPLCRAEMTKKPRVFKPGRWQTMGGRDNSFES